MKKLLVVILCFVIALGSIAGCAAPAEEETAAATEEAVIEEEAEEAPAFETVKIRVGAMPYYLSIPLQVMMDEGLDEEYGIELEIISFPSGGPMAEALGAGQWDIGPIGAGGMVAVPTYNAKLVADVQYEMDGAWIMARPDSDIVAAGATLPDYPDVIGDADTISGKVMLGTFGNISQYMGLDYADKFGLTIDDIEFMHMETSQVYTSFVAGNGDLACMGSPTAALKLQDEGYIRVGGLKQQGVSQQDAMLISDDFYTNNYEACVRFMQAWLKAAEMLNADTDYEVEKAMKFYTENGRTDVTEDAVRQECEFNSYVDPSNVFDKPAGEWMTGLVEFMVNGGYMEQEVLDAMATNIKQDVIQDAVAGLE